MPASLTHRARRIVSLAAGAAVVAALAMPASGEPEVAATNVDGTISLTPAQIQAMMAARSSGPKSDNDDLPSVDKVADGLKHEVGSDGGLFSVYYAADPSYDTQGKILAALPGNLMNTELLLATSIGSGQLAGYQWSDYLIRMERRGDEIAVMVPDLFNRGGGTIAETVNRTYQPRVLVTLPIVAKGAGGETVVDLSPLTLGGAIPVPGSGFANRSLSRHTQVKVFPDNVLIEAERVSSGQQPQLVSFSFRRLPQRDGYRPRVSDERIGYFETVSQDWGKPFDARETIDRYVNRWHVEKLDESLEMSPPKEPIIFYVESTVPIRWRKAVQDGIDEWNKAFEQVGIVGAIEVRQQTDSQYSDIDPADARYNFIRWIVSGRAFAMGPSRVDPRTGQILDADIIFDDSMLRFFQDDLELLSPKALVETFGPEKVAFWAENPGFRPMGVTADDLQIALNDAIDSQMLFGAGGSNMAVDSDGSVSRMVRRRLAGAAGVDLVEDHIVASRSAAGHGVCNFASGVRRQMALAHLAGAAPTTQPDSVDESMDDEMPDEVDEAVDEIGEAVEAVGDAIEAVADSKYTKQDLPDAFLELIVKEVVAHEVGHTLGLRHNFKASSWLTLDEIKERRGDATLPTSASVMDYNPVLLFAGDDPSNIETFITPVLGPYDNWAIEYGYKILPRRTEKQELEKIASQSGKAEYAYATDEDVMGSASPDPDANRFDMSANPVAWAKSRVELGDELLKGVEDWAIGEGERNAFLRRAFLNLFFERVGATRYVVRQIGGQNFSRTHFGDAIEGGQQPGLTPLSAAEQREALDYLAETVFADGFFNLDPDLLNKLAADRSVVSSWPQARIDFPIHDYVLRAQNYSLSHLCDPTVLQRIYDAELKTADGDDKLTAAETVIAVKDAVWKEIGSGNVDSLRRNLQQQHLDYLLEMADSEPGRLMAADLRTQVRYQLRLLATELGEATQGDLDAMTAAHYVESADRIMKVLNAPHMEASGGGGGTIIMMLGQEDE